MTEGNWRMRIEDILAAIARIDRYTGSMTYLQFEADERTIDAVTRNLAIIGEAARHVPAQVVRQHEHLPWHKMRGMRNVIIHDYPAVDTEIVGTRSAMTSRHWCHNSGRCSGARPESS